MIRMGKNLSAGLCQLIKKPVLRYVCIICFEYVLDMYSYLYLKVQKLQHFMEQFLTFTCEIIKYLKLLFPISNGILKSS